MQLEMNQSWQTKARGSDDDEYQIYLDCADNGEGLDSSNGCLLLTYEEWLEA